jgi:hypothetical protein
MAIPNPQIGSIVYYVPEPYSMEDYGKPEKLPAIVVKINLSNVEIRYKMCCLHIFCNSPERTFKSWVPYSAEKEPGTWHWPESLKPEPHLLLERDPSLPY